MFASDVYSNFHSAMDLPQTCTQKVYTYTQFLIGIGVFLIHEPHDHNEFWRNPKLGRPPGGKSQVDYIGFMSLSSYNSLPMEYPLQGMDPTHNLQIMLCKPLGSSNVYTGRAIPVGLHGPNIIDEMI